MQFIQYNTVPTSMYYIQFTQYVQHSTYLHACTTYSSYSTTKYLRTSIYYIQFTWYNEVPTSMYYIQFIQYNTV